MLYAAYHPENLGLPFHTEKARTNARALDESAFS
jgi:hypothetical protein